jgi:hypothetical protein
MTIRSPGASRKSPRSSASPDEQLCARSTRLRKVGLIERIFVTAMPCGCLRSSEARPNRMDANDARRAPSSRARVRIR